MSRETTPAALLAELASLRKQTKLQGDRLQRAGIDRRKAHVDRMIDRATLDALALVTIHVGGGSIARDVAPLPQRRRAHAIALLRLAGLVHGAYPRIEPLATPDATLQAIQHAAGEARRNPALWARRMPAYNRPKALQAAR